MYIINTYEMERYGSCEFVAEIDARHGGSTPTGSGTRKGRRVLRSMLRSLLLNDGSTSGVYDISPFC